MTRTDAFTRAARMIAPLAVGAALSLALTACGSETETASSSGTDTSASSTPADEQGEDKVGDKADEKAEKKPDQPEVDTTNSVLPSVQVKDVAGGEVDLAALVPSRTPILLWAWAPHCPTCAGEAPAVEAFAKKHADSVTVVGIGTQDDLALAEDFVSTYGVSTPQMLWDPGFESWQALEITGQPTWVLLSPGGEEIDRWQGGLPEGEILDRV